MVLSIYFILNCPISFGWHMQFDINSIGSESLNQIVLQQQYQKDEKIEENTAMGKHRCVLCYHVHLSLHCT